MVYRGKYGTSFAQVPEAHEAEVETWSELEDASNRARSVRPHLYVALAAAHFKLHHTAHMKECSAQTRWVRPYICCIVPR